MPNFLRETALVGTNIISPTQRVSQSSRQQGAPLIGERERYLASHFLEGSGTGRFDLRYLHDVKTEMSAKRLAGLAGGELCDFSEELRIDAR